MDASTHDKKRKSTDSSSEETRGGKVAKNGESAVMPGVDAISISDAAAHLHSLLQAKENELKDKEADFKRRVDLYESKHPSLGSDTDVIQLNVGGRTNIAVLRRTLTLFEGSMLAAKFSGRWDDSMEKDRDGNMFVDQDPEHFMSLVNYLRLKMNNRTGRVAARHSPKPSYSFCSMLDYYNLMPGIYPQKWVGKKVDFTCEETSYGTVVLSTSTNGSGNKHASVLHDFGAFASAGVSEFTVVFEKGTTGSVGWLECGGNAQSMAYFSTPNRVVRNSIFLNISERKIFGPSSILEENLMIDHSESTTTIICRYDGQARYSVELVDTSPQGGVSATLVNKLEGCITHHVFPMISFFGKVTVSCFKYAIDQL